MSRDQLSWDTGGRQEWCLEAGDPTSETAETMDARPPASAPHPGPPSPPGHTRRPPAPPSCGNGNEPASGGPAGHLHTHVKLRLGKSPDTVGENRKREKRFVFERKVSVPLGLSLGLGSWEPRWVGPFLRPGHGEPGRVSSPSTRVCVPPPTPSLQGQQPLFMSIEQPALCPLFGLALPPLALVRAAEASENAAACGWTPPHPPCPRPAPRL